MGRIFKDKDPLTGEQVFRQTHSDAVLFEDGKTLTEKMGGGGDASPSVYTEDVTELMSELRCTASGSLSPESYITVDNDEDDPHNGVVTVVKNQTQGRFGWFIGRTLPVGVKIDVDVAYSGTGSTQGYYSSNMQSVGTSIEGAVISKDVTHMSFIVNNINGRYIGFQITSLQKSATITFSNFRASYWSPWDEYNKWAQIDYDTEKLLKVSTNSTAPFALLHFSDIHGDTKAAAYIRRFYDRNSARINDMLSTGDTVQIKFGDDFDFYTENKLEDALFTLGNHDGASADSVWVGQDRQQVYERYIAPNVTNWGITQPANAATDYLFYYYKDYTAAQVRLICLDGMHHGQWETIEGEDAAQIAWFQARLNEVLDSTNSAYGYKVIVASHFTAGTFNMEGVLKNASDMPVNFGSQTWELTSIQAYAAMDDAYATAIDTFISGGGKFVIWLCGHYHTSGIAYLRNHPNILVNAIDQAGTLRNHGLYRESDTPTEIACANVVSVTDNLIRFIRVGYHQDGYLRSIKSMCYDWVNKKVISEQ